MKVALIEAGHWHVPLYLPAFEGPDLQLVAVSDSLTSKGEPIARRFGATFYADTKAMLDTEQIDFVYAFGRHIDMPAIARDLIARSIPFAIEKPCGRSAADVRDVRLAAEAADVYVAIPFVLRYTDVFDRLRAAARDPFVLRQAALRFIAGPITRYDVAECAWLRDAEIAGGGSAINVGQHFYDMLLALAGEDIVGVSSAMNLDGTVDDYSLTTLRGAEGLIASIETGYRFPTINAPGQQRDFSVRLITDHSYLTLENDTLTIRHHGTPASVTTAPFAVEMDAFFPLFARAAALDWQSGRAPRAGLGHLERAMELLDAAYDRAKA